MLHGHDDDVTCVAVSSEVNTVLSGSRDGSVIVYSLRSGQYLLTIQHPASSAVDLVALASNGWIAICSHEDRQLHSYTINHKPGRPPLASVDVHERLAAISFSSASDVLFTAGDDGVVRLRRTHDLGLLHELRVASEESPGGPGPLRCLTLSTAEDFVLAGTQRGTICVWSARPSAAASSGADGLLYATSWSTLT